MIIFMFEELEKKQINKNNSTQISPPATPPLINQGDISKHKNEHEDKQEIEDIFADIEKADTLKIKNKENEIIESSKALLDTDQDGLTDEEELGLGLNINKNDSDDDGLFDREELRVYKTDPLNKDTDGDGYLDGAEVKNGFNPNGAGRLYDIN